VIADLAGSERMADGQDQPTIDNETIFINTSLLDMKDMLLGILVSQRTVQQPLKGGCKNVSLIHDC
jgi:hypothetical protein